MPTLLILLLNFFHPGHWESFSWFLFPFDIPHLFACVCVCVCVFEHFIVVWNYKMLQAHLEYFQL